MLERQFRRYFQLALSKRGVTGEILLQLLETRLDNVVHKLGFANTLRAARQMVSHGHVTVNGRKTNISSMNVKAGDKIAVRSTIARGAWRPRRSIKLQPSRRRIG